MNSVDHILTNKALWTNLVALVAIVLAGFHIGITEGQQAAVVGGAVTIMNLIFHTINHKELNDAKVAPAVPVKSEKTNDEAPTS